MFTDKVIAKEDSERIKRSINMTKVGQLFEEEKQEALRKLEKEMKDENHQEIKKIKKENRQKIKKIKKETKRSLETAARRMLQKGIEPSEILNFIPNLSYKDIEALKEKE